MFKKILVPIDIAHRSSWQEALPEAIELAAAANGEVTVVTVVRDLALMFEGVRFGFQLERAVSDARMKLLEIVASYPTAGIQIASEVRWGSIGREILAAAADRSADLILMASHRPEIRDYVIGPNAAHVAQHAKCSVLVLRRF